MSSVNVNIRKSADLLVAYNMVGWSVELSIVDLKDDRRHCCIDTGMKYVRWRLSDLLWHKL